MMIYLLAYLFMNLGAFLVVTLIHNQDGTFDLRDYPGLYRRAPLPHRGHGRSSCSRSWASRRWSASWASCTCSPPSSRSGPATGWFAVVGAVNAAIAAYYYARVLKTMIIDAGRGEARLPPALAGLRLVAALLAANVLPLLFWSRIEDWARAAAALYTAR